MPRLISLTILAIAVGCSEPAAFRGDTLAMVDRRIVPEHRGQIEAVSLELFGTPDEPHLPERLRGLLDLELLKQAAGPVESHTPGVTTGLYRRHCARCHGVTGDGAGPTALYQHPYPRDFRPGVFKWKSTVRGAAPTDDDLRDLLERGVPGTAMPSFALLGEQERAALVEYVKYLAIRGQTERMLIDYVAEELDFDPDSGEAHPESRLSLAVPEDEEMLADWFETIERQWGGALVKAEVIAVDATHIAVNDPQRLAHGKALFHDAKRANCVKCHGEAGRGGIELADMDDWCKRRQAFIDATAALRASTQTQRDQIPSAPPSSHEQIDERLDQFERQIAERRSAAAEFLPPVTAEPRRLAGGVLRGGQLASVLHEGIAGTPMPGVGESLTDDEIDSLAVYVKSLLATETEGAP